MTGTTEETRPIGLTTRVTDALDALRARVRGESGEVGAPRAGAGGIPPMPTAAPTVGMPPEDFFAPDTAFGVPPMPEAAPTVGVPFGMGGDFDMRGDFGVEDDFGVEGDFSVPPMPEAPPTARPAPPVPPMPSTAPIVPPVPPYAPPTPAADDGGTAHLFTPSMDTRLHKYPFCAPPLNQNTYGSRQRHRRVSQVPRQGRGVS